ncbi:MAG: hypothetical protein KC438_05265 [Thermomicrobiales bacterium]|nr:hypothetical protein [Thermomicrobiales bacterium]MCO5220188.1 hypothetical protein [Thermomicrobiales bacterium]
MAQQVDVRAASTPEAISKRVLDDSRRMYGSWVDDDVLQNWVSSALTSLLTDSTRVTIFVPVLAMRVIRERADRYAADAA